ncbi:restriction endonuclease [Dictyobacter vulcani]|uniref:Restriction endonuclease n=1 Tax=Dictyobacter vulcani TaxID=2607529 RepID=A0A5J4KYP1_9CHLR|nr:restriction endonuclease [Dictyobacter vulcani]
MRAMESAQTKAAKDAEKARKDYERAKAAGQKEQARLYTESRIAQVQLQNEQLEQRKAALEHLLLDALSVDPYVDVQSLKQTPAFPPFDPGSIAVAEVPPPPYIYTVPELTMLQKLLPGAKEKHAQEVAKAQEAYKTHLAEYSARENVRQQALAEARAKYDQQIILERQKIAIQHEEIDTLQHEIQSGVPQAVIAYFSMILNSSIYPEDFPQDIKLAYVPESKQLVIEYDLPLFEVVPEVALYKYVKARDSITETARPPAQRKSLYASVIAQVTLRTLHELFKADRTELLDTLVFNGYVASVDKGTGRSIRTCLITVRTSRDVFTELNLHQVDPQACLAVLNASLSKSPSELAPVRPVLEFKMVDPRFIEEEDVLSGLDQRPNLMELTPSEFESLITNLFQKMGLETRQTQASRDGGVDCVAYDPRPIFGGKVVIQAKRYKNTVGVSSVRDLYGTMQNEGASKGILVTTSGYGKASYEFADGKPLELLSGSNLLYLLKEHADIEAKIQIPESWNDPQVDL